MLTYKRKLILNKSQQSKIDSWIGICRFIYNMSLEIKMAAWRNKQQSVHKYELMRQLTEINSIDWIREVPIDAKQNAIERIDRAYKSFFKGSGFPKFSNKSNYQSITFKQNLHASKNMIKVAKIGWLKMFKDSEISGEIKTITIKKEIAGYFACITTDSVKSIQCQDESQVLGIDMGIKHFAVDSNGVFISNPRHFKTYERQLRIKNRSLSRKKKGGKNWAKQARKVSLLYNKISNVRKDFLHKRSTEIAKENNIVIIEDLNISGMSKNSNLSKHILDCGWGMFRKMLEYKTSVITVDAKFTSQVCSHCGHKYSRSRISQSKFLCTNCGSVMNADVNAALNIYSKGIAVVRQREAKACA